MSQPSLAAYQNSQFKSGIGLKFKFTLWIVLLISAVMGLVTFVVRSHVRSTLIEQMQVKGLALARGLANNASEALLTSDRLLLAELVDKASKQEQGILFAALVNDQNIVIAHNEFKFEGKPYTLPEGAQIQQLDHARVASYFYKGEEVLDFDVPVKLGGKFKAIEKNLGRAHVVYSLTPIQRLVYETLQNIFMLAAACLGLGFIMAFLLVGGITRPIKRLADAAKRVGGGELDYKLEIKARDEIGHLAFTFNGMAINLKKAQAELIVKERLQQEMEIANQIQKMLVPKVSPSIPGYSIGQMYRSAEEVGGDYFDFIDLGKQQWGMVVADVSGKGVPGALVMAQTRAVMRSIAHDSTSPAKVLARTNAQLYGDMRENMFVTLSYFVLDAPKRSVTLSRAGHLAALIYRRASRTCEIEMPIGIAIGISDPETFELMLTESKVKLNPGDFILVYTDGVDEAANINKELFGADRLVQTLIQSADQSADQIVKSIDKAIRDFTRGAAQSDDITMILIKAET